MKNTTAAITFAIAAFAAGSAFAGDAADVKLDMIGMSAREAFPAQYGVAIAPGKTRAEVQAEMLAARNNRDSGDNLLAEAGQSFRSLFPQSYGVASVTPGKTRAQVKAEYAESMRGRDSADDIIPQINMSLRQLFPKNFGPGKTPATSVSSTVASL